jgi:hypothetical protein
MPATREVGLLPPVRCAIVRLVLGRAFTPTANLLVVFGLEIVHEHVELDYSFLSRIVVLFFGLHAVC